jgi:predicted amidophosphoribosyltransferase
MRAIKTMEEKRCGGCGAIPYDGDRFCARCGRSITAACPGCRIEHQHPVTYFCTICGGRLKVEE